MPGSAHATTHARGIPRRAGLRFLALLAWILAAGRTAVPAAAAQQFQFILRNGDRITGAVVAEDGTTIILTNAWIGRVLLPAAQVERREPVAPPKPAVVVVTPAPATNAPPPMTAEQKKRLDELTQVYMANQISAEEFQRRRSELTAPVRPKGPKHWTGEMLAGIDLGYGAKSRQYFSGRVKLNYTEKRFKNAFDYLFTYGHTDGELSADRMDTTDKIDFTLDPRHYLYVLGGGGHDKIRKIDYYLQVGPGVGRHLIQRTNLLFNAEAGANYQLQNFEGGRDSYLFYFRLAEDLKWSITPKFTFDEKVEYTPQWDDPGQFKIRGEANLRYWLLDNLSLNLTAIDLYDTRVARGIDRNDLQIRSSIGVKF